jgi:hypothetical protein
MERENRSKAPKHFTSYGRPNIWSFSKTFQPLAVRSKQRASIQFPEGEAVAANLSAGIRLLNFPFQWFSFNSCSQMVRRGAELSPYAPRGFEEKNDYPK